MPWGIIERLWWRSIIYIDIDKKQIYEIFDGDAADIKIIMPSEPVEESIDFEELIRNI